MLLRQHNVSRVSFTHGMPVEVSNRNLLQALCRSRLNSFHRPIMVSFWALIHVREEKEVGRVQVWTVGRLRQRGNVVLDQQLPYT